MHPFKKETVFFDLETTGTDPNTARIVEISMTKAIPGKEEFEYYHRLVNPKCPIPKEASDVNGITDDMVANEPDFAHLAQEIMDFIGDADLGGYNIKGYDLLNLTLHFEWAGFNWSHRGRKIYDAFAIFCKKEPRNLTNAYKKYCNKDLEDAHSATADTNASLEVFIAQKDFYGYNNLDEMSKETTDQLVDLGGVLTRKEDGEIYFRVGKYKGIKFTEVAQKDNGYLTWILEKSTMCLDTRRCVYNLLTGKPLD